MAWRMRYCRFPYGTSSAVWHGMNANLLETLRLKFGTVSSRTELSGVVAVPNKTAYRTLQIIVEPYGCSLQAISSADRFPKLVRVTEVPNVDDGE